MHYRAAASRGGPETVEKVACQLIKIDKPLFREELHERQSSISREKVGLSFVRGVISEAHVPENDEILFYSVVCGRRNSLREGFFDKLRAAASRGGPALSSRPRRQGGVF